MRRFRFINHDEDNRPMMDEDGNWQYKKITERAKAFEDWKKFIDNKQQLKNIEKNPATTNNFLERMVDERSYDMSELLAINKEINKNKINKNLVERNLGKNIKGKGMGKE